MGPAHARGHGRVSWGLPGAGGHGGCDPGGPGPCGGMGRLRRGICRAMGVGSGPSPAVLLQTHPRLSRLEGTGVGQSRSPVTHAVRGAPHPFRSPRKAGQGRAWSLGEPRSGPGASREGQGP